TGAWRFIALEFTGGSLEGLRDAVDLLAQKVLLFARHAFGGLGHLADLVLGLFGDGANLRLRFTAHVSEIGPGLFDGLSRVLDALLAGIGRRLVEPGALPAGWGSGGVHRMISS